MKGTAAAILLSLVSCTPTIPSNPDPKSGVDGRVLAGPTCPVEQPGTTCPDRPVVADIEATKAGDGPEFGRGRSDAEGRFRIALGAGRYVVSAVPREPFACEPATVTVPRSGYVSLTIRCDTGIR